jgi:hypothetical protein
MAMSMPMPVAMSVPVTMSMTVPVAMSADVDADAVVSDVDAKAAAAHDALRFAAAGGLFDGKVQGFYACHNDGPLKFEICI